MVVFPNCKINLGLHILDKRSDGFHNLATVFYPIPLKDALEITRRKEDQHHQEITFTQSGNAINGNAEDNICIKAYQLLKKDFPQLPAIQMHLHKAIPMGAGLGGGSADAAFTLKLINEKFQLGLSTDQLINHSLQLGSDCPFFIINQPCYATGRGEILEPVKVDLSGYQLVFINPGIHINTGWAFSQLRNLLAAGESNKQCLKTIISQPVQSWKNELVNDFEKPVFGKYPLLQEIKEYLYLKGAVYAAMSGSGSTLYGIFGKNKTLHLDIPDGYFTKAFLL
jgi:4-diphosphocytidyl-2-C-methyl-D-erythritol kinase